MSTINPNSVPQNNATTKPANEIQRLKRLLISIGVVVFAAQLSAQQAHKFPTPKPTEAHKILANDAGTWDTVVKMFFQGPTAPPVEYKGVETAELVGGSLYLRTTSKCKMGDQDYEGHSLIGYNPRSKEYAGTSVNNFAPAPIQVKGTYDAEKKTLTMLSAVVDGKSNDIKQKEVTKFIDDRTKTLTSFMLVDAGGKEMEIKLMEVTAKKR
ncbi:MAG: DUF1579 domain-containing protein [Verrucomicrobiales bacterium]|nr:DUF1579 domain-containing protein [Verrucomicrobiales bacterium]